MLAISQLWSCHPVTVHTLTNPDRQIPAKCPKQVEVMCAARSDTSVCVWGGGGESIMSWQWAFLATGVDYLKWTLSFAKLCHLGYDG